MSVSLGLTKVRRGIGYLVAAAIVGASIWLASYLVSLAPKPERQERAPQIPFAQTARVVADSGAIPVYGAGTVTVSADVDIAPQVSGRVAWMGPGFQSGGRVEKGPAVFRTEDTEVGGLQDGQRVTTGGLQFAIPGTRVGIVADLG